MRYKKVRLLVLCFALVGCGDDPEDLIIGKWLAPNENVYEFFPDGTCKVSFYGGCRFSLFDDARLKTENSRGTVRVFRDLNLSQDRIELTDEDDNRYSWYRYDGATNPTEVVGVWKEDDDPDTQHEDANYLRLHPDGSFRGGRWSPGSWGVWFVRSNRLVLNSEGLRREGTVEAGVFEAEVSYGGKEETSKKVFKKYSDDPEVPLKVYLGCYSGVRVPNGFASHSMECKDVGYVNRRFSCDGTHYETFGKYDECVAFCTTWAETNGLPCKSQ